MPMCLGMVQLPTRFMPVLLVSVLLTVDKAFRWYMLARVSLFVSH